MRDYLRAQMARGYTGVESPHRCRESTPVSRVHTGVESPYRCRESIPVSRVHTGVESPYRCRESIPVSRSKIGAGHWVGSAAARSLTSGRFNVELFFFSELIPYG